MPLPRPSLPCPGFACLYVAAVRAIPLFFLFFTAAINPGFAGDAQHFAHRAAVPCPPQAGEHTMPVLSGYTTACANAEIPDVRTARKNFQAVLLRHKPEKAFGEKGAILPPPEQAQWLSLVRLLPTLPVSQKLQYINGFFNNRPSIKDIQNYGQDEYWASPEEFLQKGGDCEDFALSKYLALRHTLNWPEEDVWMLAGHSTDKKRWHMVLVVREGKKLIIMDNLSRPAHLLVPEKTFMQHFLPLFAINHQGSWVFARTENGQNQKIPPKELPQQPFKGCL